MRKAFLSVCTLLVSLVAATGCAPQSTYRYSAAVPAAKPLAWDGRTAKRGSVRVEGSIQNTGVRENLVPTYHDTAVHVPKSTIQGAAFLAIANEFELGFRASYAHETWMQPSALGTMPLGKKRDVFGYGPEARISLPLTKILNIGMAGNVMYYNLPVSEWTIDDKCTENRANRCFDGYRNTDNTQESFYVFNLALYPSIALDEHQRLGHVFFGWSAHTTFKNDGFTDKKHVSTEDSLNTAGMVHFLTAGYGISYQFIRASMFLSLPLLNNDSVVYGPSVGLTLGGQFKLF
jgi:hypothetical protein